MFFLNLIRKITFLKKNSYINSKKHILNQSWKDISFMHWKVDKNLLSKIIPKGLVLDLYEDEAYVGVIPFMMKNVRPRWAMSIPFISNFPEFNIRTYVRSGKTKGVFFLTLDAQSMITRLYATGVYHLPYRYSRGYVNRHSKTFHWKSSRLCGNYALEGYCESEGESGHAEKGSLEEFFLERYFLFVVDRQHNIKKGFIHHDRWRFEKAKAKIVKNSFLESFSLGVKNIFLPDFCHVSDGVKVKAWALESSNKT